MSFPAYPEYKDSGVAWLGEVPVHWSRKPLKFLTNFVNGAAFRPEDWSDEGVPIVRIENLNESDSFNRYNGEVHQRYHVRQGDLLFGWSGNKGTSFGPFIWRRSGLHYLNQHIFRLTDFSVDRDWLYWALRSVTETIEDEAHGIIGMVHVTKGKLGSIQIPVMGLEEQKKIANFLNHQTARIDALIEEQQRLIELLKEKRQAVISHAVTKGLDPEVPMKDSGVEWLGEVPEHWVVDRIKWSISLCKNGVWGDDPQGNANDFPCVRVADFNRYRMRVALDDPTIRNVSASERAGRVLQRGDLVLEKSGGGEKQPVGFVVLYEDQRDAVCSNFTARIALGEGMVPSFWRYVHGAAYSIRLNVPSIKQTSGIQNLDQNSYFDERAAFPPPEEQRAIADFLDEETDRIDKLIREALGSIDLLKERRSALISAAVTGKIDVRDWTPPASSTEPEHEGEGAVT
ncbi:restriction endonuclease subunit S [Halorhodospira sp. 9622]|uniref:restriction endonuclease subunit S n=1 Tax=Halorhodospira sp. 9622 TaxID=2899136 RepID=UPI001EE83C51|nr:restriction endonuclease subunit S [Halorhodospira sp. 9622]MCG5539329.1 restriction endonuclease subunit S [Halorhodospira sp. 9622]